MDFKSYVISILIDSPSKKSSRQISDFKIVFTRQFHDCKAIVVCVSEVEEEGPGATMTGVT